MTKVRLVIDLTGDSDELNLWLKEHLGFDGKVSVVTPRTNFHIRLKESWLHGLLKNVGEDENDWEAGVCDGDCRK